MNMGRIKAMEQYFISSKHKERFINMVIWDKMSRSDMERASLFYIISGNEDLYNKRRYIYDCSTHCIHSCFEKAVVDFSSSMRSLIRLGFNLYNGWSDEYTTPISLLGSLDNHNLKLAGNAIMMRFNNGILEELLE